MPTFKTIAIAALLATTCPSTQAQKVSNIDFDGIKAATTDSASTYFYPKLLARFINQNIPLSDKQYTYLYYGSAFTKDYAPYERPDDEKDFYKYYNKGKWAKALPYGLSILRQDPLYIRILLKVAACYEGLGNEENVKHYQKMFASLFNVIKNSGDGKSIETAYVVTKVADEYAFMDIMFLYPRRQVLEREGPTDVLYVKPVEETPQNKDIKKLFFNVSKPFATLSNGDK